MVHPAARPERDLLRECKILTGPPAVLVHLPTGLRVAVGRIVGVDDLEGRTLWRLRIALAAGVRASFHSGRLAEDWWRSETDPSRLRDDLRKHRDFPAFAALALDAMAHRDWRLKGAAGELGVRPWSLPQALSVRPSVLLFEINARRAERGLKALRAIL